MREVLVGTPLKNSTVSRPYKFANGISIRELSPICWGSAVVKMSMLEREREDLATTRYWLCAAKECESTTGSVDEELYAAANHAAMALQIICPTGAKHVFLKFHETSAGWENHSSRQPRELLSTPLGRITHSEHHGFEHFDAVYAGIQRAFREKLVRLQNPILLLEHGQQIGHVYLSSLLFVMALDMLFMAGTISSFQRRLGGFLGLDSLLFPPDSLNRQSRVAVRDVLKDLYDFRNIIAHGHEIPKQPYREEYDLTGTGQGHDFCYADLMRESGLFMLTTALRKVFTEGLYEDVADLERWRRKMKLYEQRYKGSGGGDAVKLRGR